MQDVPCAAQPHRQLRVCSPCYKFPQDVQTTNYPDTPRAQRVRFGVGGATAPVGYLILFDCGLKVPQAPIQVYTTGKGHVNDWKNKHVKQPTRTAYLHTPRDASKVCVRVAILGQRCTRVETFEILGSNGKRIRCSRDQLDRVRRNANRNSAKNIPKNQHPTEDGRSIPTNSKMH